MVDIIKNEKQKMAMPIVNNTCALAHTLGCKNAKVDIINPQMLNIAKITPKISVIFFICLLFLSVIMLTIEHRKRER